MNVMHSETLNNAQNPWSSKELLSAEIAAKATPVDYAEVLNESSVLMLGENHHNAPIRDHLAAHAAQLKAAGITHYAIEAPINPAFDELNTSGQISLASVNLGPLSAQDKSYERAVQAMVAQGIKVVPIDIDQGTQPTKEKRETFLTDRIKAILADNPTAKVAVLIGGNHAIKKKSEYSVSSTTTRLVDAGIKLVAVQYAGGEDTSPTAFHEAVLGAGMGQSEFMMDLRPYQETPGVVYGPGSTDYVVHLPQNPNKIGNNTAMLGGISLGHGFTEHS